MNDVIEQPIVFNTEEVAAARTLTKTEHSLHLITEPNGDDGKPAIKIGDKLWVQEEHRPVRWRWEDGEVETEYRDGTKRWEHYLTEEEFNNNANDDYLMDIIKELEDRNILSNDIDGQKVYDFSVPENLTNWRAAEVMPRFASRLHLLVVDVQTKPLSDLTESETVSADKLKTLDANALVNVIKFEVKDRY